MEPGADYICTCVTDGICLMHVTGIPFPADDDPNLLAWGMPLLSQDWVDERSYIDHRSNRSLDYGYWTGYKSGKRSSHSGPTLAASAAQYVVNPDLPFRENSRSNYSASNGRLHEALGDNIKSIYFNDGALAQPPRLSVVTNVSCNRFSPPLNSASTDVTMCPSATDPFPPSPLQKLPEPMGGIKTVGSKPMRVASTRRRTKPAEYSCPFPRCEADFTSQHNLDYHMNAHLNHRPYKCEFRLFGCTYEASAPRTVKRHNETCKYNPKKI